MPERHDADTTSRGGAIVVATRNAIAACPWRASEEDRCRVVTWLHVDRSKKETEEEEGEDERKQARSLVRIADCRTERPPRGFLSRGRW